MFFHVGAYVYMPHSKPQLTSIKQLQGSFATHLVCAVQCYSGCPLQSISTKVPSLFLLKSLSRSSFSFSTIPFYSALSSSYSFLILPVISVSILHPNPSHISTPFLSPSNSSSQPSHCPNLTESCIQANCCAEQTPHCKHTAPQNAFHYINICIMHTAATRGYICIVHSLFKPTVITSKAK